MCVRIKKIRRFSSAVRHTQNDLLFYLINPKLGINLRIIVIVLIIMKLFEGYPVVFFFKEKEFFFINICVLWIDNFGNNTI